MKRLLERLMIWRPPSETPKPDRKQGGPVTPGTRYWVGKRGREEFRPPKERC